MCVVEAMSEPRFSIDVGVYAREAGRVQGRQEAIHDITLAFSRFATTHPIPVVQDELWAFVNYLRELS